MPQRLSRVELALIVVSVLWVYAFFFPIWPNLPDAYLHFVYSHRELGALVRLASWFGPLVGLWWLTRRHWHH
jgi:hypothetical protein